VTQQHHREMRGFWNARAREDPFHFVDNNQPYGAPDLEAFWNGDAMVEHVLDGLGVTLRDSDSVLEIGCGVGRVTRALAARAGEVLALDVSSEMLAQARRLNPQLHEVRWILGDGVSLAGISDESVDACVSLLVFQHIPDPAVTLGYVRELGRVLRPRAWAALQVSNDPAVHRPRFRPTSMLRAAVGRGPKGQRHPAWLGSHVELSDLRAAAADGGMDVERVWGEGSQYCQILLRRPAAGAMPPSA